MRKFAITFQEIYTYTVNISAATADEAREIVQSGDFEREIKPDVIETDSSENWNIEEIKEVGA